MTRGAMIALGILPALFFFAYFAVALERGRAADSLWMCHIANLILAAGILARRPRAIALAVAWIVLGIPLWAFDLWRTGETSLASVLSHLGGLTVGLYVLSRVRISYNPWLPALLLYLVVQQLCRWLTPAEMNVNLAHRAYEGWEGLPGGYGAYWLGLAAAAALALWGIGRLLMILFPRTQ
jgi:hypothetical protein